MIYTLSKTKILSWLFLISAIFVAKTLADTGTLPSILIDTWSNDVSVQWYYTNSSWQICVQSGYFSQYSNCWGVNSWIVTNNSNSGSTQNTSWTVNSWSNSNILVNSWANNTSWTTPNFDIQVNSWNLLSEFGQALAWMYSNWITTFSNEKDYLPDAFLTREQASKLIWKAYQALWYPDVSKNSSCVFKDSVSVTPVLLSNVQNACKRWLFKWNAQWNFLPSNTISKAEIMVVLIRMFEWKNSDETTKPRRSVYFRKWYAIGITNQNNWSWFEALISRREVAIFLYRLKNIVSNEKLKTISLNTISQIKAETVVSMSWNVDKDTLIENLSAIANNANAINDPELGAAIGWMYDNWLTSFNSITEYKPFEIVSRLQSAKILSIFTQIFNLNATMSWFVWNECIFTDLSQTTSGFKQYVENICKMWLLKWTKWKFNPEWNLLKSQFIVALMRLFEWKSLDETATPWWKNYFQKAQELGIVWPADIITFENPVTRYEMALFLYRFKVKYQMIKNLNTNRIPNEVISMIDWTIATWTNWLLEANVYLDTNLLKDWNFEIWYIDIMWNRYKIAKTDLVKYFTNSFVWYGDVFNMQTEAKIWTVSFIVNNGYVIESSVRLTNSSYSVQPIEWVNTYYKIKQL